MCWKQLLFSAALSALAAATLPGCESAIDRIDRDTRAAIREHALNTLGQDGQWADPVVDSGQLQSRAPAAAYDRAPGTVNPAADQLPAANRGDWKPPSTQPGEFPVYKNPTVTDERAVELDLAGALAYAFEHAPDYRNEKEKLFLSTISLLIQRHLWGPQFFDTVAAQFSGQPENGDQNQAFSLVNELGVTQKLPYGGNVSARAVVGFVDRMRLDAYSNDPLDKQISQLMLGAQIPFLRGAGPAAQEDLIQAQRDLVYAVRGFETFRRGFLVKVSTSYYELLRAQGEIANRRRQVENLEWLVRRTSALADAGRIANFEVQRSQLRVLFAKSNLVNAQEKYNVALDAFKLTIGMATRQPLSLKATEVTLAVPETTPEESMASGLNYRLELKTSADRVDDARRKVEVAKNATLPGLDLKANTTLATNADNSDYRVGMVFDVPLDRQVEELKVRSSMIDSERAKRDDQLARDRVVLEVRQGMRTIEQARFTLEVQTRNIAIAKKRIEGVTLRLRSLGPRDFIEAQDDLLDALNLRDTALRDLRVSILTYLYATGQVRVGPQGQWRMPGKLVAIALEPEQHTGPSDAAQATDDARKNPGDDAPGENKP